MFLYQVEAGRSKTQARRLPIPFRPGNSLNPEHFSLFNCIKGVDLHEIDPY